MKQPVKLPIGIATGFAKLLVNKHLIHRGSLLNPQRTLTSEVSTSVDPRIGIATAIAKD